jgi:hypothetical protein
MDTRGDDTQWNSRALHCYGKAWLRKGEAWPGRAAERQRKDVTCKGDEWPGNAAERQGTEKEKQGIATKRNS